MASKIDTKRWKCPNCKSTKVILLERIDPSGIAVGVWTAELNCGKCGRNIWEWGT